MGSSDFPFPPINEEFFSFQSPPIPIGPIMLKIGFGVSGGIGLFLRIKLCLFSMKVTAWLEPWAGLEATAFAAVVLGPLQGGLRINARILETKFPIFATVTFKSFPLKVCMGVDLVIQPLKLRLEGFCRVRLCAFGKCWKKTLFSGTIWKWQAKVLGPYELFRNCDKDEDPEPANFGPPQISPDDALINQPLDSLAPQVTNCRVLDWEKKCDSGPGKVTWPKASGAPMYNPPGDSIFCGSKKCSDVENQAVVEPETPPGWEKPEVSPGPSPPTDDNYPPPPPDPLQPCTVRQLADRPIDNPGIELASQSQIL